MADPVKTALPEAAKASAKQETVKTSSNIEVHPLYTPADLQDWQYDQQLGYPGQFPFTRGVHPTMYRGRLWTMRQYAGMGDAEESNRRYKYLLRPGPRDSRSPSIFLRRLAWIPTVPLAMGEVGKVGVAIDSIEDMQRLFDGINLEKISTSMTINATASILLALYIAVAKRTGRRVRQALGHRAERCPEGIHRAWNLHLSSASRRCAS